MTAMFDAVRAKIYATIQGAVPGVAIHFENAKFSRPAQATWVDVKINDNFTKRTNFVRSVPQWRRVGVIVINVMVPLDHGVKPANDIKDTLFQALADRNFNLGQNGYLKLCYATESDRGTIEGYLVKNMQVEYYHDFQLASEADA